MDALLSAPTLNPALREFWLKPARNRVLYGGRASSKSWDAAGFATFLASNYRLRILCVRQFQNKIEESVYPTFTGGGIAFTVLFTPELSLGGLVQVTSSIEAAHGEWVVISIVHSLEAETPGGAWLSQIMCQRQINV